jgi:hypothetical protein
MTFMMKRFTRALRRGPARLAGRRIASCEILEGRRLMSTGMQLPQAAGETAILIPGGWEPRWIEMAPTPETAGAQAQFVSNLGSAGLGTFIEVGPGGAATQIMSGDSAGSTASATVTSPAMNTSPGDLGVGYGGGGQGVFATGAGNGTTNAAASIGALPGGIEAGTGGGQIPVVTADGAGSAVTGSSLNSSSAGVETVQVGAPIPITSGGAASTVANPEMNTSTGDLNVGYGGGQGVFVARASDGATTTGSSIGALPGGVAVGTGGAQVPVVIASGAGSAAGATVTSPAMSTFPGDPNLGYGGGRGVFVTRSGYGATNGGSSGGALAGSVEVGTGGGQTPVVAVDGAGSTTGQIVAVAPASNSPASVSPVAGGAPMQVVSGTQSQASAPSVGLG